MIELTPTAALTLYFTTTLAFILGLWIYQHVRVKKVVTAAQELVVCEYCHFAYLGELSKEVTQCPQCRSYNRKGS